MYIKHARAQNEVEETEEVLRRTVISFISYTVCAETRTNKLVGFVVVVVAMVCNEIFLLQDVEYLIKENNSYFHIQCTVQMTIIVMY